MARALFGLVALALPLAPQPAALASQSAAGCVVAPEVVRFPADVYLFHGLVEEPLLEGSSEGEWVLRVRVIEAVHLPESLSVFDIVPQRLDEECNPRVWTRREMIDGFVSGDEVKVAAYATGVASSIGTPQLASTPMQGLVLLAGRSSSSVSEIRDSYDYLWALHRIDKELDDLEKVGTLTAIGRWIDNRNTFSALLEAQLSRKRFRGRLLDLYDSHHLEQGNER